MRSGRLDRVVQIQRATETLDDARAVTKGWATFATMRARLVENGVSDRERAAGATSEAWITLEMRWLDGITLEHRLVYEGAAFDVKEVSEIGRRRGLTIKAEKIGP